MPSYALKILSRPPQGLQVTVPFSLDCSVDSLCTCTAAAAAPEPGPTCPTAPDSGSGAPDGSGHLPLKPVKLDATALLDDTSASSVTPLAACDHAVLACSPGIPEEHYVSEAVEDAPSSRGYRDACTITGMVWPFPARDG
jgi:hypothetical protein